MAGKRLRIGLRGLVLSLLMGLPAFNQAGQAADQFPFDRELLLDVAPMRPVKRVPVLSVEANGNARIDLWCKTVRARVELSDAAISIEPAALPDGLPAMMSDGQCTPARISADLDLLAALTQVTAWREQGGALILAGAKALKFRAAAN